MKAAAIINSRSRPGAVRRVRALLESEFGLNNADISCTEYAGHANELAQRLSKRDCDVIIACGGDGTINEIINGIDLNRKILAVVPMGTANDLASLYRIPSNLREALSIAKFGTEHRQDVISINGRKYATVGGLGLGKHAIQTINAIRARWWADRVIGKILGSRLYCLGLLVALMRTERKRIAASLQWDDDKVEDSYESIIFGNQAVLGRQFRVLPGAVNDDGQLDVFTISARTGCIDLLSIICHVLRGKHPNSRYTRYIKCGRIVVDMNSPSRFFCDGEIGGLARKLDIRILPKALRVIVPKGWNSTDHA